jgi:toxin ParE1/3/4
VSNYRITEQAAEDLKKIWIYTATNHGHSQANHYTDVLKAGCAKIAANPTMWRVLQVANEAVRFYRCEHHYIVYLFDEVKVIIIAFLHERMDFIARLKTRL